MLVRFMRQICIVWPGTGRCVAFAAAIIAGCARTDKAPSFVHTPHNQPLDSVTVERVIAEGRSVDSVRARTAAAGKFPVVYEGACEGELCSAVYDAVACFDAKLRDAATPKAPETMTVRKGDTVHVREDVHLLAPGIVVLKRPYVFDSEMDESGNDAPVRDTLRMAAGDTVLLTFYTHRGWDAIWRGRFFTSREFWGAPDGYRLGETRSDSSVAALRGEQRTHYWWKVTNVRDGRTGWRDHSADTAVVFESLPGHQYFPDRCNPAH